MNAADRYVKLIEWSDSDGCFLGSCPELFYGGCHGSESRRVFDDLCEIVEETIALYREDGKSLPPPMSGRQFVSVMQGIASSSQAVDAVRHRASVGV
ncbi:MAG: hypothetical protein AUJ92_01685 [Armatimonadetes bacterium CG2_30_59_28]|nr:type II toxin-antitoxin system HicB family antitoxin [Armatimonadota bacterium]OIO98301.1 MAG: hypothetical protein AUJ92_01685 [Armatimonadetes bacterium CG2_30_59_28]PIU66729.1 MAG: hypothetical protein COS85_03550 [Armatimonadetes bacterium CG07_land_8_20_14_0_80_59_28]PIY42452.1 MAG: hypothetical protein COZ05_13815 [Armatimonadetes bacterium CG_4_10_14_3_um_filter_59_10]PJB74068.1 MAG: hypothetical protein CO095_05190 [Armatimonadetes bacterium CG_4_9_14_3_um_filter_58_7]